jgi:hypothetical protein
LQEQNDDIAGRSEQTITKLKKIQMGSAQDILSVLENHFLPVAWLLGLSSPKLKPLRKCGGELLGLIQKT